jgi:hypothetical protein
LEDHNREIQQQITRINQRSTMSTQQREELKGQLEDEVKTLQQQIDKQ